MAKAKKSKLQSPIVSRRERELLDNLELLKNQGKKTTIAGFARDNGYANKSALRHFPVLRRELSDYVGRCSSRPPRTRQDSLKLKYLESQLERQCREDERFKKQTKTIPQLRAKIAKLEAEKKQDTRQIRLLRGMLSTCISFLSGSDFAKARNLSERLEKQAQELIDGEDAESSD